MSLFRERLLARLVEVHAISPELVKRLLAWKHPGFSAHVGDAIPADQKLRLEDTAADLVRNALYQQARVSRRAAGRPLPLPHEPFTREELQSRALARWPVGFALAVSAVSGFVPV